jgi:hypothetical protein
MNLIEQMADVAMRMDTLLEDDEVSIVRLYQTKNPYGPLQDMIVAVVHAEDAAGVVKLCDTPQLAEDGEVEIVLENG